MKRILLVATICLILIILSSGGYRMIANAANPTRALGWKVEPLIQNTDVAGIAVSYEYFFRPPQVDFFDLVSNRYRQATYVGVPHGNCGEEFAWECMNLPSNWGLYLDAANFRSADNQYYEQGWVYLDPVDNLVHFEF